MVSNPDEKITTWCQGYAKVYAQTNLFPNSPFVQRVWIALEAKGMSYQYLEVDPYKKPDSLLEVNPRGLVPALRHGDWGSHESTVLMEYVCVTFELHSDTPDIPSF